MIRISAERLRGAAALFDIRAAYPSLGHASLWVVFSKLGQPWLVVAAIQASGSDNGRPQSVKLLSLQHTIATLSMDELREDDDKLKVAYARGCAFFRSLLWWHIYI